MPQSWSRAIHEHGNGYDGIVYRSRHDASRLCLAIFERAADALAVSGIPVRWTDDSALLDSILEAYKVGLL